MQDLTYQETIDKMWLTHIDYLETMNAKKESFDIVNGLLWYNGITYLGLDMKKLQDSVNTILDQKPYYCEFVGHKEIYARNEEEVREFLKQESNPTVFLSKIIKL